MNLDPWQWALAAVGAMLIGISKTGVGGLSVLFVAIFANLMPTKLSSGFALPLLVLADFVAVGSYRRHTQWRHLWRLLPWTMAGVVLGYVAMRKIDDRQATVLVGGILCGMVVLHLGRRWQAGARARRAAGVAAAGGPDAWPEEATEHGWWFAPLVGVLAGFATLVANAAGPLMAIYLLAMRLPKLEFMGTGAVYFLLMNFFKVPFMVNLGLVTAGTLQANLWLAPAVLAGAWLGRVILHRLKQKWFENLALALAVIGALNVLRQSWGG